MTVFGVKFPALDMESKRMLREELKSIVWRLIGDVVLSPVEVLLEKDFDKLTYAKDPTLTYVMSVIHVFLKRQRPSYSSWMLHEVVNAGRAETWASKIKGAFKSVLQSIKEHLTNLADP